MRVDDGLDARRYLPELPRLRTVALAADVLVEVADGSAPDAAFVAGLDASVRPADDMVVMFTSGSRGAPKGVIHTHGGALGAVEESLGPRCLGRGDRLYIPMPFFWMGGFGGGLLSALVAGATLITEAEPEPARTLALLERERVTLFRGWPEQAAALAAHPDVRDHRPVVAQARQPRRGAPARAPPPARHALEPVRHDRVVRALLRRPARHRPAARASGAAAGGRSRRWRCASSTSTPAPRSHPARTARSSCAARTSCVASAAGSRSDVFTVDGFYPTGDLGWLDADGYLFFVGRRDDMVKVKGATVYPSEVETALLTIPGVARAPRGRPRRRDDHVELGAVGRARRPTSRSRGDDLAREAKARLSAFKVPSHWVVIDARRDARSPRPARSTRLRSRPCSAPSGHERKAERGK